LHLVGCNNKIFILNSNCAVFEASSRHFSYTEPLTAFLPLRSEALGNTNSADGYKVSFLFNMKFFQYQLVPKGKMVYNRENKTEVFETVNVTDVNCE